MEEHALVLITCPDPAEARAIARRVVETRLAAGAQILPIESVYTWRGEIVEDEEVLLIVKTRAELFDRIEEEVGRLHSYQVPPIVMVAMARATSPYLAWIDESTHR